MLEYNVSPNDDIFIRLQLSSSDTGLFPRAKVYEINSPATEVDIVDLDEIDSVNQPGLYGKKWTNNGERTKYFTQTRVYTNSGHTNLHPIIRPDSDSINVGFNTTGGVIVGSSLPKKQRILVERLTEEEIAKIVAALFALLKPELDKKSEFNPNEHVVKTNVVIPEIPAFPKFPDFPAIPSTSEITTAVIKALKLKEVSAGESKKIIDAINSIEKPVIPDHNKELQNTNAILVNIQKVIDETKSTGEAADRIDDLITEFKAEFSRFKVLMMITNGETPSAIFQELKTLPKSDIDKLLRGALSKNKLLTSELLNLSKQNA